MMKLSVLDQSPVHEGVTPRDALVETIELARHVDGLGYRRYWLAEHHGSPGLVGTPDSVKAQLVALAESYGVDEIVVLTICHDFAARQRSYTLLAEAFGLIPPDSR